MDFFWGIGFPIIHNLIFLIIFGVVIFALIKHISMWNKNNKSPRLTVDATVVSKRNHAHRHNNNMTSTSYYATFQVESGDRMELLVSGSEYGMLAEGDFGRLTVQGTRYISFERKF